MAERLADPSSAIETVIIGGGISGLACARTLHAAGRPFVLVTDRLGGRMHHSEDGTMNFGAVYITADYHHVARYVGRGQPIRFSGIHAQTSNGAIGLWHWRNLRYSLPLARLALRLRQFRHDGLAFQKAAGHVAPHILASRYPRFDRYRRQPAEDLAKELRLGGLHSDYLRLVFQATCFADPVHANALLYLGALLPLIVPAWAADFRCTYDKLTRGIGDNILLDRVQGVGRRPSGTWEVRTAAGRTLQANNVVLAVPAHNLAALYPVPFSGHTVPATVLYVRGQRRPHCQKRFLLLPPAETGLAMLWRRRCGADQVISMTARPDLEAVYHKPKVVESVSWKTALVLSSGDWAPMVLEPGLYIVGDLNVPGLEASFLTGMCAAHQIIREGY